MKKSKEYNKLRDRINSNEYLLFRLAEKKAGELKSTPIAFQSAVAKETSRIQLYRDLLEWMPFNNTALFDNIDDTILPDIEKGAKDALDSAELRTKYYDPVAFEETLNDAINTFSEGRGKQFSAWFRDLYAQRVTRQLSVTTAISKQYHISKMSRSEIKAYRSLLGYIRKAGLSTDSLSDEFLSKIAVHLKCDKKWLKNLLSVYKAQFDVVSGDKTFDDDPEIDSPLNMLEDPSASAPFLALESLDKLSQIVDIIATADTKEYTLLFWNNLFLHPLKDVLSERELSFSSSPIEYLEVLRELEPILITRIFVRPYLCFCLKTPPEPDSMDHIYKCKSIRPFIQKTICEYKSVSASSVSQQRKKFEWLQKELRDKFM